MSVIVLFGGPSDERHVSVASAQAIVHALGDVLAWFWAPNGAVHDVALPDLLAHQRPFEIDFVPSRPAAWPMLEQALDTLPVDDPLFLLALHGGEGEDGTVQRMMERRRIRFTGSGSEASAIAFDKARAKEAVAAKVPTAESYVAHDPANVAEIEVDPGRAFDYLGKYLGSGTREVCPARIPEAMRDTAQAYALASHLALG